MKHLIVEILEDEGFEVIGAENGRVGVQMAKEHLPELIICDVMMSAMTEYQVLEALHQDINTNVISFIYTNSE